MPDRSRARVTRQAGAAPTRGSARRAIHVRLLGTFEVTVGGSNYTLPRGASRIVALLGLNRDGLERPDAAALLTPHLEPQNAAASLRTELARLRARAPRALVEADRHSLRLGLHVTVDSEQLEALAVRITARPAQPVPDATKLLVLELLPRWDDEWLDLERTRLRDLCLNALDVHARALTARGDRGTALITAYQALRADRLRESAAGALIEIYLSQGNQAQARNSYIAFEARLEREGLRPSTELRALVAPLLRGG